jgi:hypothetical protein
VQPCSNFKALIERACALARIITRKRGLLQVSRTRDRCRNPEAYAEFPGQIGPGKIAVETINADRPRTDPHERSLALAALISDA